MNEDKRNLDLLQTNTWSVSGHNPMVSVIVPNYNHSLYLKQRIDSILNQTFTDFELILLDDCSTDNSRDILLSYKHNPHISAIIINESNTGSPFRQWKKGIESARGKYVWIAESDDYASPIFLEKTVKQMEKHPQAQICLTGSVVVDSDGNVNHSYDRDFDLWEEDGKVYMFQSDKYLKHRMLSSNLVYNASMVLFRRKGSAKTLTDDFCNMRYCGDWFFWILQICNGTQVLELHEKLNYFRKHGQNQTFKGSENWNCFYEVCTIKKYMYDNVITDKDLLCKDRADFYRAIKHSDSVSDKNRRKKFRSYAASTCGVTYGNYLKSRFKRYLNYFSRKH